jgi:hypothetical protein
MSAAMQHCFTIDGEWLCDFARTRVIEGRWDHALKILETLHGISIDQMVQVLKGDAKLTGDSNTGIGFEPDDDAEYKTRLQYMFGGVWNNAGRYMRAYAAVTAWGPDDMTPEDRFERKNRYRHNSLYYANDPRRDVVLSLECEFGDLKKTDVLWEDFSNFPHLLVDAYSNMDAQKALDANPRRMEERGYHGGRRWVQELDEAQRQGSVVASERFTTAPPAAVPGNPETLAEAKRAMVEGEWKNTAPKFESSGVAQGNLAAFIEKMTGPEITDEQIEEYRKQIVEQAGDNWLELKYDPTGENYEPKGETTTLRIPQAPFENWCLWRGDGAHLALPWKTVAPSGLKMYGDDPYHTDFMLGAGLDLNAMKDDSALSSEIWELRHKVQQEKMGFKCTVLCGTGETETLKAVHPKKGESCDRDQVAVIPNAGPDYVAAANSAGAVIRRHAPGGRLRQGRRPRPVRPA